jgi:putative spermidine/putrescine transport system permease protein
VSEIALQQPPSPITGEVADAALLKARLRRATRRAKIQALLLVAPLFLFILITFVIPILTMLYRSVDNPQVVSTIPATAELLASWEGPDPPSEEVFATLAQELKVADDNRTIGQLGTRLNYEVSGMSSLLRKTGRRIDRIEPPYKEAFIDIDDDWADPEVWRTIKQLSSPYTLSYYLAALDMKYGEDGGIEMQPGYRQIYVDLFLKTLWLSLLITVLTLLLGYPIAYLLASLPLKYSNLLMILVLLPFWTSLLVRTTSWIVLLQTEGVLNDLLVWIGVIGDDGRLRMVYNQIGTVVAMTHILLPFMILPLYSVMKTIPPSYLRAARSLGANPLVAYWRVYVPQTMPGVGAGAILVFILAIGYYITPALVGGESGQLISNMIAYHMQTSLNWGLAAALGTILLAVVLALYLIYTRVVGVDNMKLG